MSDDERKSLVLKQKEWYNRQTNEKKDEMKQKKREYSKNRYYNHIIEVK